MVIGKVAVALKLLEPVLINTVLFSLLENSKLIDSPLSPEPAPDTPSNVVPNVAVSSADLVVPLLVDPDADSFEV